MQSELASEIYLQHIRLVAGQSMEDMIRFNHAGKLSEDLSHHRKDREHEVVTIRIAPTLLSTLHVAAPGGVSRRPTSV